MPNTVPAWPTELLTAFARHALEGAGAGLNNGGWEHLETDVLGVHDHTGLGQDLLDRYADADAVAR